MQERSVGGLAVREWGDPAEPGVLLWPGLGSTAAYFESVAAALPGRAVAVDPPGFGRSAPVEPSSYERLVEMACAVVDACGCHAMIGHSLGGHVTAGVAADPPMPLRAAVLIDGGFMDAEGLAELGLPATAPRAELAAWMEANAPRFPDWDTATRALAAMIGGKPTPALAAYAREVFGEVDGEIREIGPPDRMADLVLAVMHAAVPAHARSVAIPTLSSRARSRPETGRSGSGGGRHSPPRPR